MARMDVKLIGIVERVTFHNPDTGFAVLRVQATGRRGVVTVVGSLPSIVAGEQIEATGSWVQDREHGQQFKASELKTTPPHSLAGIEKYLGSGLIKGIGPHFAKKIVQVFGERTLEVIDESPSYLKEVKGIGPRRIQLIRESWQEQKAVRHIMVFLQTHGIGTTRAVRIYKTYGDQAVEIVRANPYRLAADVWGFGFETADALARKLGMPPDSPERAQAALRWVLQRLSEEGHVGYSEMAVIQQTADLTSIPDDIVRAAVELERSEGNLVREPFAAPTEGPVHLSRDASLDAPWLYLKPLFLAELGVARAICNLRIGLHPLRGLDVEAAVKNVEQQMGLELAEGQREALRMVAKSKLLVVTGGPGVGKTTLVRGILELFSGRGMRCGLCAPTGRAAKRLNETTGREAKTIHRLLEFDPALGGFRRDREHRLDFDLLVIDETSMVDVVLMNQLLRAISDRACVVFVGDVDQLPSVGAGMVLKDLIGSSVIPVTRLTEVFRQAGQSWIVRAAHQVNEGCIPEAAPAGSGDFYFVEANEPGAIIDRIITMVRERIPKRFGLDPMRDVQVLTPMNRTELGTQALNTRLQDLLNPARGLPHVERFGVVFRTGDKVLQTRNDYQKEVFNGDIGLIRAVDPDEQMLLIDFDGREVAYDFAEMDELTLAYALSIHRAQGSEYPAVVIPLHTQHFLMLQRNLLYTALTRGKKLVVLAGSRKALELAVQRQDTAARCSALRWRLQQLTAHGTGETLFD
jgi:exodeoxyribonuclease V alpha subunit